MGSNTGPPYTPSPHTRPNLELDGIDSRAEGIISLFLSRVGRRKNPFVGKGLWKDIIKAKLTKVQSHILMDGCQLYGYRNEADAFVR